MKELFLLLALTFNPNAQVYTDADYKDLWAKVETAMAEGKPQTAVTYLNQLEKRTISNRDTLTQYRVMRQTYECMSKYNWKEANKYYPKFNALERQLMDNLDYYIEKYVNHPEVDNLIYEKIIRLKRDEDSAQERSGKRYKEIRRMCTLAAEQFPKSSRKQDFLSIIEEMDSKSLWISCEKNFIYPGDILQFELWGRNISSSEFAVYRLSDRYQVGALEKITQLSGNSKLVTKQRMTDYKEEYNIQEKLTTEYCFATPGIYIVANHSGNEFSYAQVYVSKIALATRNLGSQNQVYIADARSGKPLENATVYSFWHEWTSADEGKVFLSPDIISQKLYKLDGFTALSQQLFPKKQTYGSIFAESSGDKWAPAVDISQAKEQRRTQTTEVVHYLYTDRKLYREGDTIQFKLIAVTTNHESGKVLSGKKIDVELYAPTGNKPSARMSVTTNDMGSAAGAFVVPKGSKNGMWRISTNRGSTYVEVEAYKDPKNMLTLDKIEEIYGFETPVVQRGRLTAYTGEPVAQARVEYTVKGRSQYRYGVEPKVVAEGTTRTDADGRFEVPFTTLASENPAWDFVFHEITVRAVAPGGETTEVVKALQAQRKPLAFNVKFDNEYQQDTVLLVNKTKVKSVTVTATNNDGVEQKIEGKYRLERLGKVVEKGSLTFGTPFSLGFGSLHSGDYTLVCTADTPMGLQTSKTTVAFFSPDDKVCPVKSDLFFYPVSDKGEIDFMVGTTCDDLFVEMELFDDGKVVYRKPLHLKKSAQRIKLDYKSSYEDQVTLRLFGIRDMKQLDRRYDFGREVASNNFEIKVSSLRDKTTPNTKETFTVEAPSGEMLVSIYDITTDRYRKNNFNFSPIHRRYYSVPSIWSNLGGHRLYHIYGAGRMMAKSAARNTSMVVMDDAIGVSADMAMVESEEVVEEMGAFSQDMGDGGIPDNIAVREDFGQTLAFIPQLAIPSSGKAKVEFTTRDGLSTFRIAMLAHTKNLRSGFAERTIVVNKPVKIESHVPLFAVEGDELVVTATVTNTGREKVAGKAILLMTDAETGDVLDVDARDIKVELDPDKSQLAAWRITIPKDVRSVAATVAFDAKNVNDAEKHKIEVLPASRYITEAESFIVGGNRTKESCIRDLKARFGYKDAQIKYEEYTTLDALKEVLKQPSYPTGDNMIEWLDALYVNQMRGCVLGADSVNVAFGKRAADRLGRLQKSDGGFAWFPCCSSNDWLTLMFLDKTYYLREVGKLPRGTTINKQIEKALGYVDKRIAEISSARKWDWRSLTYFFAAHMEHPAIAMNANSQKVLAEYLKRCKKDGWQDLPVIEKAKLCTILDATGELKQMFAVMNSLRDYAVRNDNIGCYFPNAVMPWRGMLHTELYAHAKLAVVFAEMEQNDIARGIMQWLLLQKHNQEWGSNMGSADAIFALVKYHAPDVKFGAVYYTYKAPMLFVKPSSNQMSVEREYWRDGKKLRDGQTLRVGDKIEVRYKIDNTENRSFVVMEASRPACFYPADERSYGSSWFYCERKADRTIYYFQVLAEEKTNLSETFYVTQEGLFNSGLVQIESLYAPEYRGHTGAFEVETEAE